MAWGSYMGAMVKIDNLSRREEPFQLLDTDGTLSEDAVPPDIPESHLLEMYYNMKLMRRFDERAISLQRQGRLGTYTPVAGQEGAQVGSAYALSEHDWMVPSFREHAAKVARGVPLENILLYWGGYEVGGVAPDSVNVFTEAIAVGSQIPHATGMAWASKLKGESKAVLCYFGDGATSTGDFHEGLNFAGVFDTPSIFFCNNNQWAISVPRERQTASETLAQKATAYGFAGVQIDGMDPLASYVATRAAVEKAKNPNSGERRPTLIEAVQYRFGAHTTADDPSVYRDGETLNKWKQKDPIPRLRTYLRNQDILTQEFEANIESRIEATIADAVEKMEQFESSADAMFDYVLEQLPRRLEGQRDQLRKSRERYDDSVFSDH